MWGLGIISPFLFLPSLKATYDNYRLQINNLDIGLTDSYCIIPGLQGPGMPVVSKIAMAPGLMEFIVPLGKEKKHTN